MDSSVPRALEATQALLDPLVLLWRECRDPAVAAAVDQTEATPEPVALAELVAEEEAAVVAASIQWGTVAPAVSAAQVWR